MAIDLSANCVSRWKLNENAADTNVEDSSGNSHDGSSQRNTALMHVGSGQPPYLNGAFDFNGTTDHVTVPDHDDFDFAGMQDFSVAFWFKKTTNNSGFFINHRKSGNYSGWDIWYQSGQVWARISKGSTVVTISTSGTPLNDSNWHLCTAEFDRDNQITLRIDLQSPVQSVSISSIDDIANSEDLCIGSRLSSHLRFDGVMDCIMIFDRLLLTSESSYLYNNGYGTEGLKTANRPLVGGSLGQGKRGLV